MNKGEFSVYVATQTSIQAAIMLDIINSLCEDNKKEGKYHFEGKWWTNKSVKELEKLIPYLSEHQIRYANAELLREGYIKKDYFAIHHPFDRTLWYAVTEKGRKALKK